MALSLLKKFNFLWLFFFCTITFGQQQVSIFIEKGLIGEIGNNAQSLVNPSRTFTDLELIGAMFYQEIGSGDPDAPFTAQGNDVPGRIRFFKNDNTSIDIEALAVWSDNDPYGFGIILPETVLNSRSFVVTLTSSNGDLGLYDGLVKQTNSSSGSSNIFLYFDSMEYTDDGVNNNSETSGNASNPAADINTYYKNAVSNDVTNPTINDQSFSYFENSTVSDTLASVIAIDNVGVTLFSITSGDENNFFTINNSGDITLTEVGVNSLANDFETGTNTFTLEISIEDSNGNTATGTVTLSLLNQKEYIINSFDEKPVSETGTTNTFSIVLDTQPTDDVIFDITSSDEDEAIVTGTVTFTNADWNIAQTLTITGVDDALIDGTQTSTITISIASSNDLEYASLSSQTLNIYTTDDDSAGFSLTSTDNKIVSETGTTDTFTIVLNKAPTDDVVFEITSSDTTEAIVTGTVTFTNANWSIAQTVTITGVDDALIDGTQTSTITISIASSNDLEYASLSSQTLNIDTTDDDSAGFSLTSSDNKIVSETGTTTDTFNIVLNKAPTDDVVFEITSSDTTEAIVTGTVTFTAGNWSTAQTVTITSVDDSLIDGTQTSTITISVSSSLDGQYAALASQTVSVDTLDDDVAGFTLADTGGKTVSETGTTDTFTIVLDAQPLNDVVFEITSSDTTEAIVTGTVTFTNANWSSVQTVTITGVDDALIDGTQTSTITINVKNTSDGAFTALASQTINVDTLDDDVAAGFTLANTGGKTVSETGTTDTFTIVLDALPSSNVVLKITSSDEGEALVTSTITFTIGNWNIPQLVTITGIDDALIDGNQRSTITISVDDLLSDNNFDPLNDQTLEVIILDDDVNEPDEIDTDNDGIPDVDDPDDDDDGTPDSSDDFPLDPSEDTDTDGDGIGDISDSDADNDGINDNEDNCPLTPNPDQLDTDNDGKGDVCDTDKDGSGYQDEYEEQCGDSFIPIDTDGDSIPDCADEDDDNDGYKDEDDDFPLDENEWLDTDNDGLGNNADPDDDNDGQSDLYEIECGSDPLNNNSIAEDIDQDGIPDCLDDDKDGDGVKNEEDVFSEDPKEWEDTDSDGVGDNEDPDDDNDGFSDEAELACDADTKNAQDFPDDTDEDLTPDCIDDDIDNDGCLNEIDLYPFDPLQCLDSDGDGISDYFDSDDDNDGIWDYQDDFPLDPDKSKDTDGDGVDDLLDSDSNGDGLPDGELFPAQVFSPNGDGIGDGWNVVNTDFFPNCEVWIFTRSGELVFRKRGYQNDWKGTLNGSDLPEGSYYYNIDKEGDGSIEYKGWLYLTR